MTPLRVEAPAKLNLSLALVGRRPDGYHLLVSDLVLLELADRLLLMPGCSGLRVEAPAGEEVPLGTAQNLAWRGLVAGLGEEPQVACLTLEKRIPVAAGLGGGSSDAAAAWRLGRRFRGAGEPAADEVADLARIGADVPFFASGFAAARVEGIGERVTPRPVPPGGEQVLLVRPPFSLATASVFAEVRPGDLSPADAQRDPGRNDLLAPARRLRPELDEVFATVAGAGGSPQLTGSGPTVFTRHDDPERAAALATALRAAGLRVTETRLRREAASIEAP